MSEHPLTGLYGRFDSMWGVILKESARQGRPVTCRGMGCYFCCDEQVHCDEQEARFLVESLTAEQLEELRPKLRQWVEKFKAGGFAVRRHGGALEYKAARLWCPFLKGGQCSVYQRRPIACREHAALRDPKFCSVDRNEQRYVVYHPITLFLMNSIVEEFGRMEIDHFGVWLARIVLGEEIRSADYQVFTADQWKDWTDQMKLKFTSPNQ